MNRQKVDEEKRKKLLSRIDDPLAAVGVQIPNRVEIDGRDIPVRNRVWQVLHGEYNEREREEKKLEILSLIRSALDLYVKEIKEGELNTRQAEALVEVCIGLKRAIRQLEEEREDLEEKMKEREIEDQKVWLELIKQVKR